MKKQQQQRPAPVRVMDGAAVVTSHLGEISIRPEPGWRVAQATINVTMERERKKRTPKPRDDP